jgi:hypothetical protein
MPPLRSNVSTTPELWVVNTGLSTVDFIDSSDFVVAAVFRMVDLAVFLMAKGRPFAEVLLKFNPRVGSGKKVLVWNFYFGIFPIDFASGPPSGDLLFRLGLLASPLVCTISLFFSSLSLLCVQFLFRGLSPTGVMAESSRCSWNCSTNLDRKWCSPLAFMHSGEVMKSLADFVMVEMLSCHRW